MQHTIDLALRVVIDVPADDPEFASIRDALAGGGELAVHADLADMLHAAVVVGDADALAYLKSVIRSIELMPDELFGKDDLKDN